MSKSKGKPTQLTAGTRNQKEIKDYIKKLDEFDQDLIKLISRTKKPDKLTPLLNLKEKFIEEGNNMNVLVEHIRIVEKFQADNAKKFNKDQLKNVNGYMSVLNRIANGRTFDPTYSEEGKVVKTYGKFLKKGEIDQLTKFTPAETAKEEETEGPKPPQEVIKPRPQLGRPQTLLDAFNAIKDNRPGSYADFNELLNKSTTKDIRKNFIRGATDIKFKGYSKLKIKDLRELVDKTIKDYAVNEKLDNVVSEIEAPKLQAEKEKVQKMTEEEAGLMFGGKKGEKFDREKYIKEKYEFPADKRLTDFFLRYDKRGDAVNYKPVWKVPSQWSKKTIRNYLDDLFTSKVYSTRINNEINNRIKDKSFTEKDKFTRTKIINDSIKNDIKPSDLEDVLKNTEFQGFIKNIFSLINPDETVSDIDSVQNYYNMVESIRDLDRDVDKDKLNNIANTLLKYERNVATPEQEALSKLVSQRINTPADIRVLPEGVKTKPVSEEEMLTDLDKYNKLAEELASESAKPEDEQDPDKIKQLKEDMKQFQEGAKKEKAKKAANQSRQSTATRRKGFLRPHFKNPTDKAVANALNQTAEEQIQDIQNWYIFDLPSDQTGQGSKHENPLVKQNEERYRRNVDADSIFTLQNSFLVTEGIEEIKDFYTQHPDLNKEAVARGFQEHYYEQNEAQFLAKFNDGSNSLFSQDQTKDETSDFQNIYQIPSRSYFDKPPKFENTVNKGMTETDKEWLDNMNLFYKGAEVN